MILETLQVIYSTLITGVFFNGFQHCLDTFCCALVGEAYNHHHASALAALIN